MPIFESGEPLNSNKQKALNEKIFRRSWRELIGEKPPTTDFDYYYPENVVAGILGRDQEQFSGGDCWDSYCSACGSLMDRCEC